MYTFTLCAINGDMRNEESCKKFMMKNGKGTIRGYKACEFCLHKLKEPQGIII